MVSWFSRESEEAEGEEEEVLAVDGCGLWIKRRCRVIQLNAAKEELVNVQQDVRLAAEFLLHFQRVCPDGKICAKCNR